MLTLTFESTTTDATLAPSLDAVPSDAEISRRVLEIRSKWSIQERVRRRREADRRFDELVDVLICAEAA